MLRDYQQQDVNEILKHDSIGIFNEQRTGKTPTSITAMTQKTNGRILIVCTASMLYKWAQECKQWSNRTVYVYTGPPTFREVTLQNYVATPGAILIVSYDLMKATKSNAGIVDKILKSKVSGLIVDEAHRAVGRSTANFKSLRRLVKIPYRYYLTGTPAPNHPSQTWSLLTMINPAKFSSYWKFTETYFQMETIYLPGNEVKKPSGFRKGMDIEYVNELQQHSIQRKRIEVMPWLNPLDDVERILLFPTPMQKKYIEQMEAFFETEHVMAQGVLDQLIRVRQLCQAPELLDLKGGSPKIDWLCTFYKEYPDKSTVVFSKFARFIALLKKQLVGVAGVIVGDTPLKERQHLIDEFQSGKLKMLIIQVDAGKEGITLDRADYLVFADVYPPASDILQARDRIVATNHANNTPKTIIELAMKDTYDERLYDLVQAKVDATAIANDYKKYMEVKYGRI
jgi:SNF2 family DNA or RNA helicase